MGRLDYEKEPNETLMVEEGIKVKVKVEARVKVKAKEGLIVDQLLFAMLPTGPVATLRCLQTRS